MGTHTRESMPNPKQWFFLKTLIGLVCICVLYLCSLQSYILFHSMAEIFAVSISISIFVIAWNTRIFNPNGYMFLIGMGYLFVALVDILHTLSYKGMGVFLTRDGGNLASQLWICARYLEAFVLVCAPFLIGRKARTGTVFMTLFFITSGLLSAIYLNYFPDTFIIGQGLTRFKTVSEYLICIVFLLAIIKLHSVKASFTPTVYWLLIGSICVKIATELAFTLYIDVYGNMNLIGHLLKIGSFYLLYRAIVVTNLISPYNDVIKENAERKKAEVALLESEFRWKFALEGAGDGVWDWNIQSGEAFYSLRYKEILGFSENEIGNTSDEWSKRIHPEDATKVMGALQPYLDGKTGSVRIEFRMLCKDGSWKWITGRGMVVKRDSDGKPLRMIGTNTDISERKRIEEVQSNMLQISSVNTSEDFFETLARYLATTLGMDYVCIDTLHGDSLSARTLAVYNDGRIEDNVEYTLKDTPCGDVVGKTVCVFPREVRNLFPHDAALQELQAESYVGTTLWSFDMKPIGLIAVIGRKELSSSFFAEAVLKLVATRAASEMERRRAEEEKFLLEHQFQHIQKLESLGVLAGGIAHDFNNLLAVIMGNCSLAEMDKENADKYIPEIEKASERAAALCRQMLAYAGKASLTQTKTNVSMLVGEMVTMLKTTIQQNVAIKQNLATDIPAFTCDASQIRQVVMNLIINAAEAIGDADGEIGVKLAKAEIKAEQTEKDHLGLMIQAGGYICFEVTDDGCGMNDDTRRKIFEPFYTTKFTGRGLGMSAVLGIIKAHNGALQLKSRLGHGTTFRVYLPFPLSKPEKVEAQQITASAPWQGSGTILLVEDEAQVKSIAVAMLKKLGFNVLDAANG